MPGILVCCGVTMPPASKEALFPISASPEKSPEPPALQKIQPRVSIRPSRLGQVMPPLKESLYILQPYVSFKYSLSE